MNTPEGYSGQSNTHFFQAKFDGQEITHEEKGDWLHDMWEHGLHIIPCGSPHEIVPAYYRKRHPFDDELALKAKWAKTLALTGHTTRTSSHQMKRFSNGMNNILKLTGQLSQHGLCRHRCRF